MSGKCLLKLNVKTRGQMATEKKIYRELVAKTLSTKKGEADPKNKWVESIQKDLLKLNLRHWEQIETERKIWRKLMDRDLSLVEEEENTETIANYQKLVFQTEIERSSQRNKIPSQRIKEHLLVTTATERLLFGKLPEN